MIDDSQVAQIAARYSIPPAILLALVAQRGHGGMAAGLTAGHVGGAGFAPAEVQGNDPLQVEIAARALASAYGQTGDWEKALSVYFTGDPQAASSPTAPAGGQVNQVLAVSAIDPTAGMAGYTPADPVVFAHGAASHLHFLNTTAQAAGVVSPEGTAHYERSASHVAGGPVRQVGAAWDIPAQPIMGSQAPFSPGYDEITQSFGPTDFEMEPSYRGYAHFHMGVDYAVPDRSPLRAITGGTVHTVTDWGYGPGGPGWAVRIVADNGATYTYGHVSEFNVRDGERVAAGQQIALSGGAGEPGSGMSNGAHLHFEVRDPQGNLVDGDPIVQAAIHGAQAHPEGAGPAPELVASGQRSPAGEQNIPLVLDMVARSVGVDPRVARAIAIQESGMDPMAVGDQGTSFGLFQLHRGGELGSHTAEWAFSPANNATTALTEVARVAREHPDWTPGQIAAAAQRPRDPAGYAASVDNILATDPRTTTPVVFNIPAPAPAGSVASPDQVPLPAAGNVARPEQAPPPAEVNSFASQLVSAGANVGHFLDTFAHLSSLRNLLMGVPTDLQDYLAHKDQTPAQMAEAVRSQPHPQYPDVSAGHLFDTLAAATVHAVHFLQRVPSIAEAHKMAAGRFTPNDIRGHYERQAQASPHGVSGDVGTPKQSTGGGWNIPSQQDTPAQQDRRAYDQLPAGQRDAGPSWWYHWGW